MAFLAGKMRLEPSPVSISRPAALISAATPCVWLGSKCLRDADGVEHFADQRIFGITRIGEIHGAPFRLIILLSAEYLSGRLLL